tara:strand:- start:1020 stop:1229 length:210 start_codon:yes stop_codon:yes gene_type:complete
MIKKQILGVLVYLLVVKTIDLFMKGVVAPQLTKLGMGEEVRERVRLLVEISAIIGGIYVLKRTRIFNNK